MQCSIRYHPLRSGRKAALLMYVPTRPLPTYSKVPKLLTQFQPRKRSRYAFVAVLTSTPPRSRHGIDRPRNIVQTLAFLSKDVRSRDELQYDLSNKYADGKEDDDR
ncbi:hypothetical protein CMEL01_05535 [Colletotrichum melonis]|uniref:Uncharacterized protein n=1 Tax=Colletotrichum melonis TaxID=1209925 RepID=A0AAI9UCC8_9PEZI|nr:hypothetical protein CMEL01_05535 [Colletotrichum melonis]